MGDQSLQVFEVLFQLFFGELHSHGNTCSALKVRIIDTIAGNLIFFFKLRAILFGLEM